MTDVLFKMSEGNPGAISVLMRILAEGEKIDPQNFMGGLGPILSLDSYRVYGPKIWMLYKDVCGHDLVKMLAVLRACQLGKLAKSEMLYAIENMGEGLDLIEILNSVKSELDQFDKSVSVGSTQTA